MSSRPVKDIAPNRQARFDYNIEQTMEAGLWWFRVKTHALDERRLTGHFIKFDAEQGGSAVGSCEYT